jgi:hypothetical protein
VGFLNQDLIEKNERLVEYRKCATILLTPLAAAQRTWSKQSKIQLESKWVIFTLSCRKTEE